MYGLLRSWREGETKGREAQVHEMRIMRRASNVKREGPSEGTLEGRGSVDAAGVVGCASTLVWRSLIIPDLEGGHTLSDTTVCSPLHE
jgi:hypothetical protein